MPKHILFLFADQMRADVICALGNPEIQTPALDSIAESATVFEKAYTPSPVCVPARFSMYSGQYPGRLGSSNNDFGQFRYNGEGIYSRITKAGYQSCCVGKMHHVIDTYGLMGFEKRYSQEGLSGSGDDYTQFIKDNYPTVFDYHGQSGEMYYVPQVSQLPAAAHPSAWVGDRSLEYLDSVDPEKPVFLMSSFYHPHPPFSPPAPWNKLYREELTPPYMPENPKEFEPLLHRRFLLENMGTSDRDLFRLKNHYYACVSFVDYQIGRIIRKLKDKGMYDDTMIIVAADHGECLGDFGCMGKRTMLDPASRIPFMIRLPGQGQVKRTDLASLVDIAPTILSYISQDYDKSEFDGIDLFSGDMHDYVFAQYESGAKGAYMVTDGDCKLVYNGSEARYYFFDTFPEDKDKYDQQNPKVKDLKAKLDEYMENEIKPDGETTTTETPTGGKGNLHYPARRDHKLRRAEEIAQIPEGYKIDM